MSKNSDQEKNPSFDLYISALDFDDTYHLMDADIKAIEEAFINSYLEKKRAKKQSVDASRAKSDVVTIVVKTMEGVHTCTKRNVMSAVDLRKDNKVTEFPNTVRIDNSRPNQELYQDLVSLFSSMGVVNDTPSSQAFLSSVEKQIDKFQRVFRHKSFDRMDHYEAQEAFGDKAANLYIAEYLVRVYPYFLHADGGYVHAFDSMHKTYRGTKYLSSFTEMLGLHEYICADSHSLDKYKDSTYEDVFEAFIGAIYLISPTIARKVIFYVMDNTPIFPTCENIGDLHSYIMSLGGTKNDVTVETSDNPTNSEEKAWRATVTATYQEKIYTYTSFGKDKAAAMNQAAALVYKAIVADRLKD